MSSYIIAEQQQNYQVPTYYILIYHCLIGQCTLIAPLATRNNYASNESWAHNMTKPTEQGTFLAQGKEPGIRLAQNYK